MRKILSILLLVALGLPSLIPLLVTSSLDEASLPACCRRNGKHHCMMSMAERNSISSDKSQFLAPEEKCPYCPGALTLGHQTNVFGVQSGQTVFIRLVSQSAVVAQTESKRRISRDRSRQKRGPPLLLLSSLS